MAWQTAGKLSTGPDMRYGVTLADGHEFLKKTRRNVLLYAVKAWKRDGVAVAHWHVPGESSIAVEQRRAKLQQDYDAAITSPQLIRVRELPDWPPSPGGAYGKTYRTPTAEQAIVTRVEGMRVPELVTFVGTFEGHEHTYDFQATNEDIATELRSAISANVGKSVFELGDIEIPIIDD